jgi:hypothetical protein
MKFDKNVSFKKFFELLEAKSRKPGKTEKPVTRNRDPFNTKQNSPNVEHGDSTKTRGAEGGTPEVGSSKANRAGELNMTAGAAAPLTHGRFVAAHQPYEMDSLNSDWKLDDKGKRIPKEQIKAHAPDELVKAITNKYGIIEYKEGKPHKVARIYKETSKPLIGGTLNSWFANPEASKIQILRKQSDLFFKLRYGLDKYTKEPLVGHNAMLPLKRIITDSDVKEYVRILLEAYQKMNPESVMEINGKKYITSYIAQDNDFISYETKLATNIPFKVDKVVRKEVVPETNEEKVERLVDFIEGNEEKGIEPHYRFQLIYNLTDDYLIRNYSLSHKQFINCQFPQFTSLKQNAEGTASQFFGVSGPGSMESGQRVQNTTQGYAKNRNR